MQEASEVLRILRQSRRISAADLLARLGVSRATLKRRIKTLGSDVVVRGNARRTAYAARRAIRGNAESIPLYRIDEQGQATRVALLDPIYPEGCALLFEQPFEWPLLPEMRDGWFEGLPYPLEDMRPQGYLGLHFARGIATQYGISKNPRDWSESDAIYILSLNDDVPGNYILGDTARRRHSMDIRVGWPELAITDNGIATEYPRYAEAATLPNARGSSAAGEFPKFIAWRTIGRNSYHAIVKFSGNDNSVGVQRWSDLLVCEHLALNTLSEHLHIPASVTQIYRFARRTFLEVQRFDRHGKFGRSGVCSWSALNAALWGHNGMPWNKAAIWLREQAYIDTATEQTIKSIWHFGNLIANTDMHDGNLAFRPLSMSPAAQLTLTPVYDMLPMYYAATTGLEVISRDFNPPLPLPEERVIWQAAAQAAIIFWDAASQDVRISDSFREICRVNAGRVSRLLKPA